MTNPHPNRILPVAGVHRNLLAESGTRQSTNRWLDINDVFSPNRNRRETTEQSTSRKPKSALLRCRRSIIMASFNACTARIDDKAMEMAYCAQACGIDILGVQEHRRVHKDEEDILKFEKIESYHLITSSAWRNERQASQGGVGLLISSRAKNALRSVESITERILLAEFESNPVTTVIVCSPINTAPVEEVESFYDQLHSVIADIPAHNFVAILGDFNARLGTEDARFPYHDVTNRNGGYLSELLCEKELLAANTLFDKRRGKRWTFKDRFTGMLRQLDYILVRRKWRNSILNSEAYNTFCSVSSDHRVVSAKIRLSLRTQKRPKRNFYDWEEFSRRPDLQEKYSVLIRNKFRPLQSTYLYLKGLF